MSGKTERHEASQKSLSEVMFSYGVTIICVGAMVGFGLWFALLFIGTFAEAVFTKLGIVSEKNWNDLTNWLPWTLLILSIIAAGIITAAVNKNDITNALVNHGDPGPDGKPVLTKRKAVIWTLICVFALPAIIIFIALVT